MRIGVLARRAGVSESAIRFYERSGILPEPARTPTGYRDYGGAAVELLDFVRSGQSMGLSLAELREVIAYRQCGETPCAHVIELINQHAARVAGQISHLRRLQRDLNTLSEHACSLDPADCRPETICQIIAEANTTSSVAREQPTPR